jgi:competence protein ComEC
MAVVAGVVFFTVRALLALFPALTVGFPIKKWSAAAALAAALFYLLLSGAEVATQRSFFITAVALIVALVDRRATLANSINVSAFSYIQTVFIGLSSAWHDARLSDWGYRPAHRLLRQ